jgi:hypothetical protein
MTEVQAKSFAAALEERAGIQMSLFSSIDRRGDRLSAGKLTTNNCEYN